VTSPATITNSGDSAPGRRGDNRAIFSDVPSGGNRMLQWHPRLAAVLAVVALVVVALVAGAVDFADLANFNW
jgi:hypothetical protein